MANIKSPVFLRLEAMISTLGRFREEMDGSRIPIWEQQWQERKAIEDKKHLREQKRELR